MEPVFFSDQQEWHDWLLIHHETETELYIGFYKAASKQKGITYAEATEEALCFGWIEAVRQSIDGYSWLIRFIRRKPNGIWSNGNIEKAKRLIEQGKMQPAGLLCFEKRNEKRSGIYSYENEPLAFSSEFLEAFTENRPAWDFFNSMPKSYQKSAVHWVMRAKQEITRENRMEILINDSENGLRIDRKYRKPKS